MDYQAHVDALTDPGLLFHSNAGAIIGKLVPDYRPLDTGNLGYGVMVCYEFRPHIRSQAATHAPKASIGNPPMEIRLPSSMDECKVLIRKVIDGLSYNSSTLGAGSDDAAFMDLGIDSLDAKTLVQNLNNRLAAAMALSTTVIFDYPNIRELATFIFKQLKEKFVVDALLSSSHFADLEETELQYLAAAATPLTLAPAEVLVKEGDDGDSIFILESGHLEVSFEGRTSGSIQQGAIIGELSMLYRVPHTSTISAQQHATLWVLHDSSLQMIIHRPKTLYAFLDSANEMIAMSALQLERFFPSVETVRFVVQEDILSQGEKGDCMYIIKEVAKPHPHPTPSPSHQAPSPPHRIDPHPHPIKYHLHLHPRPRPSHTI